MKPTSLLLASTLLLPATLSAMESDAREMVEMPAMMQEHMLGNMRDHLVALHEILQALSKDNLDQAATVAEQRLGMSSLDNHGASHMAHFMPQGMAQTGTRMHRAASQFARTAEEGDRTAAYDQLNQITATCIACHAGYRIR